MALLPAAAAAATAAGAIDDDGDEEAKEKEEDGGNDSRTEWFAAEVVGVEGRAVERAVPPPPPPLVKTSYTSSSARASPGRPPKLAEPAAATDCERWCGVKAISAVNDAWWRSPRPFPRAVAADEDCCALCRPRI